MDTFNDKSLNCADCGQEFIFSRNEQAFYAERGFTNEPKRCTACRSKRKTTGGGGGGGGGGRMGGYGGGGGGGSRGGSREMHPATCAGTSPGPTAISRRARTPR